MGDLWFQAAGRSRGEAGLVAPDALRLPWSREKPSQDWSRASAASDARNHLVHRLVTAPLPVSIRTMVLGEERPVGRWQVTTALPSRRMLTRSSGCGPRVP
ncbi:MAG: hypothetical protein U1E17_05135 [Geminicoccaceae bacterium]